DIAGYDGEAGACHGLILRLGNMAPSPQLPWIETPVRLPLGCGRSVRRGTMRSGLRILGLVACLAPLQAHAGWQAVERVEAYAISGKTGIELYRSIGDNGPKVGVGRTIAYTDFKLLWSRDYRPQPDGSCVLVSARPSLTITYP